MDATNINSNTVAADFTKIVFGTTTEPPVYISSLPNERGDETEPPERHVATRVPSHIAGFVAKWDRPKRGLFFCTGIVKQGARRAKENIVQTACLHTDIDFSNLDGDPDRAEVLRQLARLRYPPSIIVFSGHGLHCYWLFKEAVDTQENIERIETALRQLADLVGGDLQCREVARLMRLPGTHNTKDGEWTEVEIVEQNGRRYELDDLEEWLAEASPVLLRKTRPREVTAGETDYFSEYAKARNFKPRVDVKARLDAMMFMAGGDAAIHPTQLTVSASLLSSGTPIDEVVEIVLAATKAAAGDYGARWNWRREERNIRGMCETWVAKHPQKSKPVPAPQSDQKTNTAPDDSAPLVPLHHIIGDMVIAKLRHDGEDIISVSKGLWYYCEGIWQLRTDTLWLDALIEIACRGLNYKSTNRLIAETRSWITRHPKVYRLRDIPWDAHGKIPTRSGLIDPITLELTPAKATDFCSWRIECDYDPNAACPWWETMIADFFSDREPDVAAEHIRVIQEVLGSALIDVKPREMSKALIMQGGSNFGKSVMLEVLAGLFGAAQISTALDQLDGTHGLMQFTQRAPWVLHEAFQSGKWHFSSIVKAIITHEPVPINIKNGPVFTTIFRGPLFWATNHPPQFKEATRAIVNRIIVIECLRYFDPDAELIGAAAEARRRGFDKPSSLILQTELPGLLNWAIKGLQRAAERGRIATTDQIKETSEDIHRDSNLVAGFLDECIEYDPHCRVSAPDFCAAFAVWFTENKGEDRGTPSNESIGRALAAMSDPRIGMDRKELRDKHRRYYVGIALNDAGMAFWNRATTADRFEGKTTNTTASDDVVNTSIPLEWEQKASVSAMRKAQGYDPTGMPFPALVDAAKAVNVIKNESDPTEL
ncbi:DNA-primase RepB domain-containing protein [Bradyrhizobium sp. Leo121]|uniref:DUF5906 domain-containing protein n=1 Tax=Bradyrhizobium sp. Leo121 TaxID=1571195 RepID=UPI0010289A38|nr:DNA-primase RepB domain-containing protein [Bradyrhizobium sp. Leo121]RZN25579.1 hypothetical protein CWO90_27410 [Bradyrhizobium sp. Leo121]